MPDAMRLVTAAELERFPEDDYRYELAEGRLIRMSPTGFEHSWLVARLMSLLGEHVRSRNLGFVGTELGVKLRSNPDTVRAPDVAFIKADRLPAARPKGFWTGPPDLAIEVLSPDDRAADIRAKTDEYLSAGVPLVVILHPDQASATIHRRDTAPITLRGTDDLDLADVVPGFRCQVKDVFE